MGSGPIRGSGSRSREQQQAGLPPWVKSVERTSGSSKAGSVLSIGALSPESSTATRAPLRTKPSSRLPAMAEKDSSAFENASHVFVVFGASVSWLVGAFGSQKWLLFLAQ